MPPWNAVKGFGDFAPDHGLSQEEIATISSWVEGGAPEGDVNHLPSLPPVAKPAGKLNGPSLLVRRSLKLQQALRIIAIEPSGFAPGASAKSVATLPDGEIVPLIWIRDYSPKATAQYRLAQPLRLPRGASIETQGEGGFRLRLAM